MKDYTDVEYMICQAARLIKDGRTVFVGYGMPQIAAILAQRLYVPNICQVYEYGAVGPEVATPFMRNMMADSRNSYRSFAWMNLWQVMAQASLGLIDYGMLGAAQIDPFGNINSTVVGSYERPRHRFTGSGGGNEVASFCWRTIILMGHEKRRFLEKVDFMTSPGYLSGEVGAREGAGLPADTGPYRVVTSKGVFDFHERRMRLIAVAPHSSTDDILDNMGFRPLLAPRVDTLQPPTSEELRHLREEIDPDRVVIGRV